MKTIILFIMLAVSAIPVLSQNNIKPFALKLIEWPSVLKVGQNYKFVFTVRNTSQTPLTLSWICAASAGLSWKESGRTKNIYAPGCDHLRFIHGQVRDPVTKQINYFTKTVPSGNSKEDFFTLRVNESKSFEVELEVFEDIKAKFADVRLSFESRYDGKAAGIEAWSGPPEYIILKIPVVK